MEVSDASNASVEKTYLPYAPAVPCIIWYRSNIDALFTNIAGVISCVDIDAEYHPPPAFPVVLLPDVILNGVYFSLVAPSNTSKFVPPPEKSDIDPVWSAWNVCAWFVSIVCTLPLPSSINTKLIESDTAPPSPVAVILTDEFVPKLSFVSSILDKFNNEPVFNVTLGTIVYDAVALDRFCILAVIDAVAGVIVPSRALKNVNVDDSNDNALADVPGVPSAPAVDFANVCFLVNTVGIFAESLTVIV